MTTQSSGAESTVTNFNRLQEELSIIDRFFDQLETIEYLVKNRQDSWLTRARNFVGAIVKYEVGTAEVSKQRSLFLQSIIANAEIIDIFEELLSRLNLTSSGQFDYKLNSAQGHSQVQDTLIILRAFLHLYVRRKYVALSLFSCARFDLTKNNIPIARVITPDLNNVELLGPIKSVKINLGLLCFGYGGQTITLKAKIHKINGLPNGLPESQRDNNVIELYYPLWSQKLLNDQYLEDKMQIEIPLTPFGIDKLIVPTPVVIELGLFTKDGKCLDKKSINTKVEVSDKNHHKSQNTLLSPSSHQFEKVDRTEAPSRIQNVLFSIDKDEAVVSYELNLKNVNGGGCFLVFDFLDRYGELLSDNNFSFFLSSPNHDGTHTLTTPSKLSFKRFIPIGEDSEVDFSAELRIEASRLGLGWRSKEIYLDIILFDATQKKLDFREERFSLSIRRGWLKKFFNFFDTTKSFP